jgi:hypothetical protein
MGDKSLRGRGLLGAPRTRIPKTPRGEAPPLSKIPRGEEGGRPKLSKPGKPNPDQPRGKNPFSRMKRIKTYEEEINAHPQEAMGVYASGGHEGKPHSTKEGRLAAGHRNLTRFFYGRKKKKPKGTKV